MASCLHVSDNTDDVSHSAAGQGSHLKLHSQRGFIEPRPVYQDLELTLRPLSCAAKPSGATDSQEPPNGGFASQEMEFQVLVTPLRKADAEFALGA